MSYSQLILSARAPLLVSLTSSLNSRTCCYKIRMQLVLEIPKGLARPAKSPCFRGSITGSVNIEIGLGKTAGEVRPGPAEGPSDGEKMESNNFNCL
jgi:hypothetical protein